MEFQDIQKIAQQLVQDRKQQKEAEAAKKVAEANQRKHEQRVQAEHEFKKASLAEGVKANFKLPSPGTPLFRTIAKASAFIADPDNSRTYYHGASDTARFAISSDSFDSRRTDAASVALLEFHIPAGAFEYYFYEGAEKVEFSVLTEDLKRIASIADKRDEVTWGLAKDTLKVSLSNGLLREYNIYLVEESAREAPEPKIEFTARAVVSRVTFLKTLEDASATADDIRLEATPEHLAFSNKSDAGKFHAALAKGEAMPEYERKEAAWARYSISYLVGFLKCVPQVDALTVEFAKKKPIKVTAPLLDPQSDARAVFWLAPRVESEPDPDESPPKTAAK